MAEGLIWRFSPSASGPAPIGAGDTPRFAIIANATAAADLTARFPRLVEARSPSAAADALWIIRPDGYVGLVARRDDVAAAQAYLAAIAR